MAARAGGAIACPSQEPSRGVGVQVRRAASAAVMVLALVAAGCSSNSSGGSDPAPKRPAVDIDAHGGTGQVWLRSKPGVELELTDRSGDVIPTQVVDEHAKVDKVDTRTTDDNGALVFRYVPPGNDYRVKEV